MKKILLIVLAVFLLGCETAQQKQERELREKVFKNEFLKASFSDLMKLQANSSIIRDASEAEKKSFIWDYNTSLGVYMGLNNDIEKIIENITQKEELYKQCIIAETYLRYVEDSLLIEKYTNEKEKLLTLLRQ